MKYIFIILTALILMSGCIEESSNFQPSNQISNDESNLSAMYPIGSVYISVVDIDPKITFEGFGCWSKIESGYTLVSV